MYVAFNYQFHFTSVLFFDTTQTDGRISNSAGHETEKMTGADFYHPLTYRLTFIMCHWCNIYPSLAECMAVLTVSARTLSTVKQQQNSLCVYCVSLTRPYVINGIWHCSETVA